MSKTLRMNAEALKHHVRTAMSADELKCGHKGKCPHCPTCRLFQDDGFPPVKIGKEKDIQDRILEKVRDMLRAKAKVDWLVRRRRNPFFKVFKKKTHHIA